MPKITLKEFLNKFTAIPKQFINEYYKFYELCKNNLFGIPILKIINYLDIKSQRSFQENIRKNFIINSDYVIIREQQKSMKGIKDAKYMLTFETFEKICMNSSTKKGQEFRDYFVMLRKFIDYYKQHIANKIIELTKTNKFVYILSVNKNSDILKLGRIVDIRKRLQTYSTGKDKHPDVKFIMIVEDDKRVEKCAKLFAKAFQYKANKELYKMHNDKLKKIIFDCANIDKNVFENTINNDKLDTYIVYDDSKTIEYLNLNDEVIGYEKGNVKKIKQTTKHNKLNNSQKGGTRKQLLKKCNLPDIPETAHCFADSTHHTCCMLGSKAREYADASGNPIGTLSSTVQVQSQMKTKKQKQTIDNRKTKHNLTPWCTCTGSKVCTYYTDKFGNQDGTHIKFIGTLSSKDADAKNEATAISKLGLMKHSTPGVNT